MTESGPERPAEVVADAAGVPTPRHAVRVGLLMVAASLLLGWLAAHTDVLFADGLRYIAQARAYAHAPLGSAPGTWVDHPVYPLAVAAVHHATGGARPDDWQAAAQLASVVAGVLLVVPLYLVSRELFGDASALPATALVYVVPLTGHVFADTLSESTFLLFWTWGLWSSLRFLKSGAVGWMPAVVGFSALAYLSRPEGLLLPAAVAASLGLCPVWVGRGLGRRGLAALGVLLVGSAALVGPYVVSRGGLGTKPSVQRLLGTAPRSAAQAVERPRPLEPGQSEALTYLLAGKAVFKAVAESVTWPLLPLAALGVVSAAGRSRGASRQWRLLAVVGVASVLALVRLHATGGYCSPRHAMILSLLLIPAAASGLALLLGWAAAAAARTRAGRFPVRGAGWSAAVAALVAVNGPALIEPVNPGLDGYRQAGRWLSAHAAEDSRVVDVTGWSQFYGGRVGYTFENLVAAPADPSARWVVAREAHLKGPWDYCRRLRVLVDGLAPVQVFRGSARKRPTRVYVFDRQSLLARPAATGAGSVRR